MSDDIFFSSAPADDGDPQPPYTPVANPITQPGYGRSPEWNAPETAYLAAPQLPVKKKSLTRTLIGAGVAGVLVLGAAGGAYAYSALASHGTQPETVVPAAAVAFAKLDLDPAADQKIAMFRLARRFPDLAKTFTDKNKLKDSSLATLFSDKPSGLDYDHDIKPWLGSRIAVAYVPDSANPAGADPLLVAGYTDEAKMKAALGRYQAAGQQHLGYATRKGFVLISDTQAHADAMAKASATLDGNTTYKSDVRTLRGSQIALAWTDLGATSKLVLKRLAAVGGSSMQAAPELKTTGRLAMGIHADSGYLELSGTTFGASAGHSVAPVRSILALPANTAGAFEVSDPGGTAARNWSRSSSASHQALERQLDGFGVSLPEDFAALLGTDLTVSAGPMAGAGPTPFAVQVTTPGGARAQSVIGQFFSDFNRYARQAGGSPLPLALQLTAKGYTVSNDPGYAKSLQPSAGATLGSTPLFKAAVPHADGALAVGFFNVGSLLNSPGVPEQDRRTLAHIGAIGMSFNQAGGAATFDLRVTVK